MKDFIDKYKLSLEKHSVRSLLITTFGLYPGFIFGFHNNVQKVKIIPEIVPLTFVSATMYFLINQIRTEYFLKIIMFKN